MKTENGWRHWRGDICFFAYAVVGGAIAYPLEQPWRAIAFGIATATYVCALVVASIIRSRNTSTPFDGMALFFHSYMAIAIAIAQFFDPPITAIVIVIFATALLLILLIRSSRMRHDIPSTNEQQS